MYRYIMYVLKAVMFGPRCPWTMAGHSCPRVAVIVSTLLIFLVSAVLNLLARVDIQAVRPGKTFY